MYKHKWILTHTTMILLVYLLRNEEQLVAWEQGYGYAIVLLIGAFTYTDRYRVHYGCHTRALLGVY